MMKYRLTALVVAALLVLIALPAAAGTMVEARCECGYKSGNLLLFGGKANFQRVCLFPAYCPGVKKVLLVNMFDEKPRNPDCASGQLTPYDQPTLVGVKGKGVIASWNTHKRLGRDLKLTDGTYLCPVCGQKTLRFYPVGMWD